ncbi:type II toxin-antitoxin system HicA family toxin [Chamaesiphon sp. VAR_48_metabat_135_sub]|uniref:type II toxin-antitoxin system HicA family toxin n=1 Tax=Chamaesiphon sp. VAR_48_metabat_135_sub TaxID=2964699 RepID=UPI00286B92C7|nr:type II toxin-antitoxin system HicA family toxin [Chamaesiphon sp. VAR_48_metabat_135_sub]
MGKREKLIQRLTNSPQNSTFADLRNLLEYEGFYLDKVTDSHHVFVYAETIFAIPIHNNKVKTIYVQKVLELIESADTELEEED